MNGTHPVTFSIDYPDRDLDGLTTGFRMFMVIPITIVLGTIGGYSARRGDGATGVATSRSARRRIAIRAAPADDPLQAARGGGLTGICRC